MSKPKAVGYAALALGVVLAVVVVSWAVTAAIVMLGFSLLHQGWPQIPALGFWASLGLCLVAWVIGAFFHHAVRKADK